jgi:tetratricopeptide (TPR) repeat protein
LGAVAASSKLGVAVLVEGNVRRRGNDLVVSVELVDGQSGLVIWSSAFKRTTQEILSVQQSVADQILAQVLPGSQEVVSQQSTFNSSANELMLLARYYETQVRERVDVDMSLLSKAIDLYRQATEVDTESAVAHSRLARVLMYANDFAGAEAPIFRAVTLNSELSEVQNTLGNYYLATGVKGAGNAFRRATELNANNADALADYAWWLWMQSRDEESEALYRRALELDPLSLSRYGALADYYGYTARVPEALEIAKRVEETFKSAAGMRLIGRIMELVGRLDASIAWTIRARDLEPDNNEHVVALAELHAEIGDFATAQRLNPDSNIGLLFKMRRYEELINVGEYLLIDEPNDLELQILLSYAYNLVGKPGLAIRLLTLAGVADRALGETRHPKDVEGLIYLIDALDAAGESELARQLATRWVDRPHLDNEHWWVHLYVACPLAILGRDDEALDRIARVGDSTRLPWESLIRDMRCFARYRGHPKYEGILASVAARRAEQRLRLPLTLKEFGVAL